MNVFFEKYIKDNSDYKIGKCLGRIWGDGNTIRLCCNNRKMDKYGLYESNLCEKCSDYNPYGLVYRERPKTYYYLTKPERKKGVTVHTKYIDKGKKPEKWKLKEYDNYKKWLKENIVIESSGLNRDSNDKFYTKGNVVKDCIKHLQKTINISNNDLIIEPSAGSGSFTLELDKLECHVYSTDILPSIDNDSVKYGDFFGVRTLLNQDKVEGDIHFIGNPPFGRQSSLAKKFIKECCLYEKCKSISFILPKSFKKDSMKKCFDIKFHLEKEINLPKNSFQINDVDHDVPCVFQIWVKKDEDRDIKIPEEPCGFHWVKKPEVVETGINEKGKPIKKHIFEEPVDFGILRAGGGDKCGRLSEDYENGIKCYEQGWLFIKLDEKYDKEKFKEMYNNIDFKCDDNVGMRSIAKPKFNEVINKILRCLD
jgi:hypothetical protein